MRKPTDLNFYIDSIVFLNSVKNCSSNSLSFWFPLKHIETFNLPLIVKAVITAQGLFFAAPATKAEKGGFSAKEKATVSILPTLLTERVGLL